MFLINWKNQVIQQKRLKIYNHLIVLAKNSNNIYYFNNFNQEAPKIIKPTQHQRVILDNKIYEEPKSFQNNIHTNTQSFERVLSNETQFGQENEIVNSKKYQELLILYNNLVFR